MSCIQETIARELGLKSSQVNAVIELIDEGNTIPFIARYRKEATGDMGDVLLRDLDERLAYHRKLEARKAEVIAAIDGQGKLTDQLRADIMAATVQQRVEDLYKPFKKKRATRASKAREAGLEPLAALLMMQDVHGPDPLQAAASYLRAGSEYATPETALQGALDIIAENIADNAENTELLRSFTRTSGTIESVAVDATCKSVYETYYSFDEPLSKIPNHRILALNRGEKEKALRVKVRVDADEACRLLGKRVVKRVCPAAAALTECVADSYKRLIAPALEREMRAALTEKAEADAIRIFAKNTESLLLQRPVRGARIIAIDPGYRTGCKVAVLDEFGKLLDFATIYPTPPKSDIAGTQRTLDKLARKHRINTIVIGNGTASRETEDVVEDFIEQSDLELRYTIVNEAGASVYSASKLASEEYPDLDVTTRGAMSLGRRLQDPLAELVKIPPQSIGVGQYQHDLNQAELARALGNVVENAVNRVGVDLNTASASLLQYVAGITPAVARNIVAYREENGPFVSRTQLKKVPKLGPKAYEQCAGFLRIAHGKNLLDATSIHPESYAIAREMLKRSGVSASELERGGVENLGNRLPNPLELAKELGCGLPTIRDIISELEKPGRDPRDDAPEVVFSRSVRSFDDLKPGMKLTGTVRNVVSFGAFVDIGVKQDGLVHVSKMSERFVSHPSEVVAVGDTVTVWVCGKDEERGKISLSMVEPKAH